MNALLILVTAASFFFLLRSTLVMLGLLKEPLLRTFEQYGPSERPYLVALPFLTWLSIFMFSGGLWVSRYSQFSFVLSFIGFILAFIAAMAYNYYEQTERLHNRLVPFPLWYHELRERTTRYERRRIAYMWLLLPFRTRLTYNSSDKLFFIWADFVIMGTIREEVDEAGPIRDAGYMFRDDWVT